MRPALAWHAGGMDLADALHLASSGRADELVTFDRRFSSTAGQLEAAPPVRVLG